MCALYQTLYMGKLEIIFPLTDEKRTDDKADEKIVGVYNYGSLLEVLLIRSQLSTKVISKF